MLFGFYLSPHFQLVWDGLQGSEVNPNSLGTADPHNPTEFLARVSSAKGGRDSVLLIGRGDTPTEGDSPLIGFRVKVEARSNLTVPVLPQGEPQS